LKDHIFNGIEDGNNISKLISERASEKFSYYSVKNLFLAVMENIMGKVNQ